MFGLLVAGEGGGEQAGRECVEGDVVDAEVLDEQREQDEGGESEEDLRGVRVVSFVVVVC